MVDKFIDILMFAGLGGLIGGIVLMAVAVVIAMISV